MIINLETLQQWIFDSLTLRKQYFQRLIANDPLSEKDIRPLITIYDQIHDLCDDGHTAEIITEHNWRIHLDLSYELTELHRDIQFCQNPNEFIQSFVATHGAHPSCEQILTALKKLSPDVIITDRDGTINNYCSRYNSSVQSLYNAFMLNFALEQSALSIIVTSAPLHNIGLADLSLFHHDTAVLAGSKGREYYHPTEGLKTAPITTDQTRHLKKLDQAILELLNQDQYQSFRWIGSGYQHKCGQLTIARQDIHASVPEQKSRDWLNTITTLVHKHDPSENMFRIEDTGKDIEIVLTVSDDNQAQS